MTAHRTLHDNLYAAAKIDDPGDTETVTPDRSPALLSVTTATAESRVLDTPTSAGQRLTVALDVDGGNLTITTGSAVNAAGNTTVTLDTAGDFVEFVAIEIAGARKWRVAGGDGHALS